ncbi:hypothetical protein FB561_1823 [Kribbella amoyensis]|uniref:Uncharacterized protein n=1 Tax=Kribbella amoyensis TaxID=996641 RepID=A0A561BPE2_9ACTN|nr:hypothetical protein [Kribbella amoyensis]TWD80735.1 hypothetical protein FB561_1823 [Kribbella amoyensis]
MTPEQQLRERMRETAAAVGPTGDPLAAIEHRATSIQRRRATATMCALLLAVTSATLIHSNRTGSQGSSSDRPMATSDVRTAQPYATSDGAADGAADDAGTPWVGGLPDRTANQYLASGPTTIAWATVAASPTAKPTDVGVLTPGDSIWLVFRCAAQSAQRITFVLSTRNGVAPAVQRDVACRDSTALATVKVPTGWPATASDVIVDTGADEGSVAIGHYTMDTCVRRSCLT